MESRHRRIIAEQISRLKVTALEDDGNVREKMLPGLFHAATRTGASASMYFNPNNKFV